MITRSNILVQQRFGVGLKDFIIGTLRRGFSPMLQQINEMATERSSFGASGHSNADREQPNVPLFKLRHSLSKQPSPNKAAAITPSPLEIGGYLKPSLANEASLASATRPTNVVSSETSKKEQKWTVLCTAHSLPVEYNLTQITSKIFHIRFRHQYWLCRTLMRMQEYAEHPFFRGQVFTADQFYEWTTARDGSFSYYTQWAGFNIPSKVFEPFWNGDFDPLSLEEQAVLDLFRNIPHPFYLVGTYEGRQATRQVLRHELAHALFYLDLNYQSSISQIIQENEAGLSPMFEMVQRLGYHPDCFLDEIQAYLVADTFSLKDYGVELDSFKHVALSVQSLFALSWNKHLLLYGVRTPTTSSRRPEMFQSRVMSEHAAL